MPTLANATISSAAKSQRNASQYQQQQYSSTQNTHRNGQAYYNAIGATPVPVFDPALPSPIVIVHQTAKSVLTKSVQERKHRGTSRNLLGGFYTS